MRRLILPTLLCWLVPIASTVAQQASVDLYEQQIRPLLQEKCAACHGALKQESGLRLDSGRLILQGGDNGAVVEPGDPLHSELLNRIRTTDADLRMPPTGAGTPLEEEHVELLREWIAGGAVVPEDEPIPASPEEHWAWQKPVRPDWSPASDSGSASTNPLDLLMRRRWEHARVTPVARAEPSVLLRRVHLDLIGLPPTIEEQQQFTDDDSQDRWASIVDRLLNDPAHGERWARHWMDVWRYSDWDGYKQQVRGSQRHIWHWRDWIVESLNADVGYDQMLREMLAADELYPEDDDALRATGFLARNYHNSNRDIWLDATVEHTAKAFLGLTINFARCHDHKYDPIPQTDYYAFRAIFEPYHVRTDRLPGESNLSKAGLPRIYDKNSAAVTYLYIGGNERLKDEQNPLSPGLPSFLRVAFQPAEVELPAAARFPALRQFVREEDLQAAHAKVRQAVSQRQKLQTESVELSESADLQIADQRVAAAEASLASLQSRWNADLAKYDDVSAAERDIFSKAAAVAERNATVAAAALNVLLKQQEIAKLAEPDEAKRKSALSKLQQQLMAAQKTLTTAEQSRSDTEYTSVGATYPAASSGRRKELARALTSPDNPLVARVAVNYIWLHHFGEPLVPNVFDFGLRSEPPPLQDVLDLLAVELVQHGWSMKHIHRLILTSELWQQSSSGPTHQIAANLQNDPLNHMHWRSNVRRLEAESIRDSVLHLAGALERTIGGPDVPYRDGETTNRRSLYYQHAYEKQMTMLVTFDAAAPQECYRRSTSVVPQQALALANSSLLLQQSRSLAEMLSARGEDSSDDAFVAAAFRQILGRPCDDHEHTACLEFLKQQTQLLTDPEALTEFNPAAERRQQQPAQRARANLVQVLFNHNDFVTVR